MRFPLPSELPAPFDRVPISIKVSDYNLDGYPDFVAVMRQRFEPHRDVDFTRPRRSSFSSSGANVPIILQNRACEGSAASPCTYNQTFIPQEKESFVLAANNATLAVFFDVLENVRRRHVDTLADR